MVGRIAVSEGLLKWLLNDDNPMISCPDAGLPSWIEPVEVDDDPDRGGKHP